MERTILHVDINGCYASIECLHQPSLRDKPVAVGGDAAERHGIILAKNELAKKAGVKTGQALWQARQTCPGLVILTPNYPLYLRFSRLAREIYRTYSDRVEPFGLDECWVDISGAKDGTALAHEIRRRVKFELGITVSVGVSFNKVFAKLGSDYKKPDAVTVFSQENYKNFVWPLPAGEMLYVGPATQRKLYSHGVKTIGDVARLDPHILCGWFGKWGTVLHAFALGDDPSPVAYATDEAIIKSIGNSTTTPRDLTCDQDAEIVYWMLAESVAERMREEGFLARGVQISLRDNELFSFERQLKLPRPTCLASELHDAALKLLKQNYRWKKPLRSIGIRATDLIPAATPLQLTIFEDEEKRKRLEDLERTVDVLRRRYGHYAVCRAALTLDRTLNNINPKEDHTIHPVGYFKPN